MNKKQETYYKKYYNELISFSKKLRSKLDYTIVTIWIRKNRPLILNYFYKAILPLFFILFVYALLFLSSANNYNFKKQSIKIERNMSANQILFELKDAGIIRNKIYAKAVILLTNWHKHIYAGRYTLSPNMSLREIFMVLRGKRGISSDGTIDITIPEGYSLQEIIQQLDKYQVVSKNTFYEYLTNMDKEYWFKKYPFLSDNDLENIYFFEGYLFPDTYNFIEDSSPIVILEVLLENFQKNIMPLLKENKSGLSLHSLITLASIIEKEVLLPEERRTIAGVFYNRIKKNMYLGSCPTVKYALGKPHKPFLLYKDLEVISPYNTYKRLGLPPSPICSPGLAAVEAALNPEKTEYLYFVAKGNGEHIFSYTYAEHQQNMKKVNGNRIY